MKKLLALLLSAVMLLSLAACGPKEGAVDAPTDAPEESAAPAPSADPLPLEVEGLLADNSIDVTRQLLGFSNDTPLMTVDGQEVPAEIYLYWLANMTAYYAQMYSYYGMGTLDLSAEIEEGVTWDDRMKEIAYENAVLLTLIPQLAAENGIQLSQEELDQLTEDHRQSVEDAGAEVYAYRMQAMNINDRTSFRLDVESALFNRLQEKWSEDAAAEVTAEEVKAYAEEQDILKAKHILLMTRDPNTGEEYEEAAQAAQKAKAEEILAQLKAGGDFDALMQENSEDSGLAAYPEGYTFSSGEMVAEFEQGTRALAYGEFSPELVKSVYGYHIILRLDPDSPELRQELAESRFNDMVQARIDKAVVTVAPEYETFTADQYYQGLLDFQSTLTDPSATPEPEVSTPSADGEPTDAPAG